MGSKWLAIVIIILLTLILISLNINFKGNRLKNYLPKDLQEIHLAILCDGNRRFGEKVFRNPLKGYKQGANNVIDCIQWCADLNVHALTLFVFSEENFKRSEEEVKLLFELMENKMEEMIQKFEDKNIRFKVLTTTENLPPIAKNTFKKLYNVEQKCKNHTGMVLQMAIGYSGQRDIEQAALKTLVNNRNFKENLKTAGVKDPDILVRTSGEKRISNFCLYQIAYTELFFVDKKWPEFTKDDLKRILYEYSQRKRRFGK